ncbi:MAG: hypothetical protein K0S33_3073 [Bacteroidetes bacterium]|jgi:hypothetical protein|nr:hypothetical protein [Bacteroidota bacterium]
MNIHDLIPKHKHDIETAEKLRNYSYEEIEPIVPELLTWLQDLNWPVAGPVIRSLEVHADKLAPELIKILRTDDGMWKYWVLHALCRNTKDPGLIKEIERIANSPAKDEKEEEADEIAREIIAGHNK